MGEHIKLNEIEIKSFRGIKNYKLETDDKSIVFCGANGTGKSSFVNAFEFLFTGKIESLSASGVNTGNKSIIHIGDDKNDVLVRANINNKIVERTLKDDIVFDDDLEDLVNDFKNGSFLLNRKKLLNFIDTSPKKRWEEAANLINFNEYDNIEKSFESCLKSFEAQLESKKKELDANSSSIEEHYELDNIYSNINEILKKNDIETIDNNTDLNEFLKEHSTRISTFKNIKGINISLIDEKYQNQLNIFEKIALDELKSTNDLLNILKSSKNYLENENANTCPVCRNAIDTDEVIDYLTSRQDEICSESNRLHNWQNENKRLIRQIININNNLDGFCLDDLVNDLEKLTNLEISPSQLDKNALTSLKENLDELENQNDELDEIFDMILLLEDRKKIENELKHVKSQYNVSKAMSELFTKKKRQAIEEIFENIGEHITEYYNFIHGDDDLSNPKVNIKNSRGLTLGLIFDKDDSDPRSYASEGHLDSLGLCIFLAFAKVYNKYNFLVLDDIISTVDLDHKEMIIRLLFEKFRDYTFLITTHNKLWYEQLQRLAHANNIGHKFTFMEIIDWDKIEGPVLSKNPSSKKRIEEHLKANDTFAAGNAIRRHLEFVLDDLCKINGIPLPLKKHYTVNDYYLPVKEYFLEEVFKDTTVEEYFKEVFQELDNTAYMGNLTSHNNEANYDLVKSEIEKFRDAVYNFEASFKCKTHKSQYLRLDKKRKTGTCSNEKCQDIFEYEKLIK